MDNDTDQYSVPIDDREHIQIVFSEHICHFFLIVIGANREYLRNHHFSDFFFLMFKTFDDLCDIGNMEFGDNLSQFFRSISIDKIPDLRYYIINFG
jgi:hypothetical protein